MPKGVKITIPTMGMRLAAIRAKKRKVRRAAMRACKARKAEKEQARKAANEANEAAAERTRQIIRALPPPDIMLMRLFHMLFVLTNIAFRFFVTNIHNSLHLIRATHTSLGDNAYNLPAFIIEFLLLAGALYMIDASRHWYTNFAHRTQRPGTTITDMIFIGLHEAKVLTLKVALAVATTAAITNPPLIANKEDQMRAIHRLYLQRILEAEADTEDDWEDEE
jgi:hypothetical protein